MKIFISKKNDQNFKSFQNMFIVHGFIFFYYKLQLH
jgi:hypothetical protein